MTNRTMRLALAMPLLITTSIAASTALRAQPQKPAQKPAEAAVETATQAPAGTPADTSDAPSAAARTPAPQPAIGHVKSLNGHATITHGQLTYAASLGAPIYEGDNLRTFWDGALGVTFKDDTRISLGPSSRLTISHFVFEPANERYGMVLKLIDGTMQYLSGLIAKLAPDSMKVETPTATVGVRGTRFLARAEL